MAGGGSSTHVHTAASVTGPSPTSYAPSRGSIEQQGLVRQRALVTALPLSEGHRVRDGQRADGSFIVLVDGPCPGHG